MTVGGVQMSVWVVWVAITLALCGLWAVLAGAGAGVARVRDWRADRREPLTGEDEDDLPWCEECGGWHRWSHEDHPDLPRGAGWLDPLPPERSREELGFTGEQPVVREAARQWWLDHPDEARKLGLPPDGNLHAEGERREPAWVTEILTAYAELGLEGTGYTRAMAARVRELTP